MACGDGEPEPAAMLTCDIRRGRPPEQRAALAQALIDACVDALGLQSDRLGVEFTQHTGDELFRVGRGAVLRHVNSTIGKFFHLRIPSLLMRAPAHATVRVWKKRLEHQAHSRFDGQGGCGLPIATGAVS